ncbi:50S ribosomal protein L11 methyltransferase [bacterium SCSIO 12696]|nr:50S ribosomal protein L11 methyltransferase [bacterium SCSIO 12696]
MSWLQCKLDTTRATVEALEDAMLAAGAVSVTFQDLEDEPILEPGVGETPLWNNIRLVGLFTADTDTTLATVQATAHYGDLPPHRWEILEDKDWEREWMANYHPIQCGERLWVCPSWTEPPQANAVNLMLDPGLAFGTGTHPTTFLCLKWLDSLDLTGKTVVDYGCGSGILGIAALLLGAEKVVAIDNDPQALIATVENGKRNNIDPKRLSTYLPDEAPALQADITAANILAAPLIELAETLSTLTRSGGQLCMAGLIAPQTGSVKAAYENQFDFGPEQSQDEWVRLSATKR